MARQGQDDRDRDPFSRDSGDLVTSGAKARVIEKNLEGKCGPTPSLGVANRQWIFNLNSHPIVEFLCDWEQFFQDNTKVKLVGVNLRKFASTPTILANYTTAPAFGGNSGNSARPSSPTFTTPNVFTPSPNPAPMVGNVGAAFAHSQGAGVAKRQTGMGAVEISNDSPNGIRKNAGQYIRLSDPWPQANPTTAMYYELVWEMSTGILTTFTAPFGIVTNGMDQSVLASIPQLGNSTNRNPFPDASGSGVAVESVLPGKSAAITGNTGPADGSNSGNGNMPSIPSNPSAPTAEAAPAPSSGGLSTGAIAGIAVAAAVVGLGLIGLLVFCLIRRRRREQGDHVSTSRPYHRDQHTATADLMGEKEAAAGGMGESPHSPYSDDGHGSLPHSRAAPGAAAAVGVAAGAGAASTHHTSSPAPASADLHRSSFTPYSDDGSGIPHPDADRATGSRSETPGGRYEHLMEQGMSAEDRARVEEEERQLDAEIERAKK